MVPDSWETAVKTLRAAAMAASLMVGLSPVAVAQVLVPPGGLWEYTVEAPGSGWQTGDSAGVTWLQGRAPFGNCGPLGGDAPDCAFWNIQPEFFAATRWPEDGEDGIDLWVRTAVAIDESDVGQPVFWQLGVDNGYALYINGALVSQDNSEGFTHRWEYTGTTVLSQVGENFIAVELHDHGGLTWFDMTMDFGTVPPAIPEPQTYALMLAGLALLGAFVCRKR
jgi:hypothetical protein